MAEERTEEGKEDDVSAPIFCEVGLDRTPLMTRVRVLPWQKDILRRPRRAREGRRGNRKRKIETDPCEEFSCRSMSEGKRLLIGETDV